MYQGVAPRRLRQRPRRLARPRTPPFHGGNTGSNPVGDATLFSDPLPVRPKLRSVHCGLPDASVRELRGARPLTIQAANQKQLTTSEYSGINSDGTAENIAAWQDSGDNGAEGMTPRPPLKRHYLKAGFEENDAQTN